MGESNDQTAICFAGDSSVCAWGSGCQRTSCPKQRTLLPSGGINVTDQAGYEASGVDKVRDAIKANGGKLIAGGYNKAVAIDSDIPAPNRFLIFVYPNKEACDKASETSRRGRNR